MRRVLLLVVMLMAFASAGCEPTVNKEVLFVGDSVTFSAVDDIVYHSNRVGDDLSGRYAPNFGSVNGGQGLTIVQNVELENMDAFWATHVESLMEHTKPEVIVVELGINDSKNVSGWGARLDNFMQNIPSDIPVYWMTVPDPMGKLGTHDATINNHLKAAVTRWENLKLLSWATKGNANPAWFVEDGVHLNETGQDAFANWLTDQLDSEFPPPKNT